MMYLPMEQKMRDVPAWRNRCSQLSSRPYFSTKALLRTCELSCGRKFASELISEGCH
ncbi:hypothetical protein E4T44_00787 [Aureobasidium sp. EXF-8845]|nr:hypothetical protein E4T44_00787 [Aureobasidium sp. EXF-8845]KAI4857790.1 hypothetical protein E4T45_00706 [Aureobasidium sp. EXF-8846]